MRTLFLIPVMLLTTLIISTAQALKEQLAKGDITMEMEDYANMEKVGSLGIRLPRNEIEIYPEGMDEIFIKNVRDC